MERITDLIKNKKINPKRRKRKMKRKFLIVLLALTLAIVSAFALTACGETKTPDDGNGGSTVVTPRTVADDNGSSDDSDGEPTFIYKDDYKKSVLKVKNNLDDTVAEYPFSYDTKRGCYFKLSMDSYWQHMGKVSSKKAEFFGGSDKVKAEVSDAKFSISGFDGTVEYDAKLANNLELALTSYVYLYTEKLSPDYKDEYTVTVNFSDYTIIHKDRTNNIGSIIDKIGPNARRWINNVFWVVVGVIITVIVVKIHHTARQKK